MKNHLLTVRVVTK